ncbi:MAG: cob(I)yrinic acid a,c-diamide adenosyltransferase [Planctomycetota bacterium]
MKIYTRTGDGGSTGLFGGPRVSKDDARIEAYGTVDELNAVLGMVRGAQLASSLDRQIESVQHELFSLGAELATPEPESFDLRVIGDTHISKLERWIDEAEQELPPLKAFVLPAGTDASSTLHLARSVCRRAERRCVSLQREVEVSDQLIVYLNRLSDFLFVAARLANATAGVGDHPWVKPGEGSNPSS